MQSCLALSCGSVVASSCGSVVTSKSGSVVASSCGYIAPIKPEAVFTLMHTYICIDGGIKLIFKIYAFLTGFYFLFLSASPFLKTH